MNYKHKNIIYLGIIGFSIISYIILAFSNNLTVYLLPDRRILDGSHFLIGISILLTGLFFYLKGKDGKFNRSFAFSILVNILSGIFMLLKLEFLENITRVAYTLFDLSLISILLLSIISAINNQLEIFKEVKTYHKSGVLK
jgi:hypothetical protein